MNFFFYGTLCDVGLRRVVLGRDVAGETAVLPGHAVHWSQAGPFAVLVARAGAEAAGWLVRGLTAQDVARLDWYEGCFGYGSRDVVVQAGGGGVTAQIYAAEALPGAVEALPGAVWDLAGWQQHYGTAVVAAAGDVMALMGTCAPQAVGARYGQMLVRGAGRVRAARTGPVAVRHAAGADDVQVVALRQPYADFFAVEEYDVSFRRFDGTRSPVVTRAVFLSGDAVTVLPYDPVRDRVLLIEQFRIAPLGRGDPEPWMLEAIAGRIDAGESPEAAARREAFEEAGLTLGALLPVAQYYPSTGAFNEFLYSYVALTDLPDGVEGVFGLEGEAEDIRGHLIGFDEFLALVGTGEVANAPLILTALWLQRERVRLRGEAASERG